MDCVDVNQFMDAYIDGEFAAQDRVEMERHFEQCEPCRGEARRQAQWKAAIRARMPRPNAPYGLHMRVSRALDQEIAAPSLWRRLSWRLAPTVLAAGVLATLLIRVEPTSPVVQESILDHRLNWPVEVAGPDPDGVSTWFRGKVDFPVRPPRFDNQVRLLGGRLGHLGQQHAAYLVYSMQGGHKVSVFVYPGNIPIEAPRRIVVRDRPVYVGDESGYRVALFRDRGIGYALASDLDESELVRLVGDTLGR
jgi:anti-sigma factor RsiW